jgi:two-component system, OmpR family, phosphate regulon response regulator PhoB
MSRKLLIIDDEPELVALLDMSLGAEGYAISSAGSGVEALQKIAVDRPDLILMDVMLPDISGTRLTGQIKNDPKTSGIPVIMLTAKDSPTDMIVGLNMGADDYVTKPFSTPVLAARIDAVLRRKTVPAAASDDNLRAGPIELNARSRQCRVSGRSIDLTPAEFSILASLMRAGGDVVKLESLGESLGFDNGEAAERNIYVHISSLRKKLGDAKKAIKTVQGLGYRIETIR